MLKIDTSIVSAGIYYNGAEIIRRGKAELAGGTQTVCVGGLSASFDQNTVKLFSSEGIKCFNQRFETPESGAEGSKSKKIKDEIDALTRQADIKKKQIELWEMNGDFTNRTSQPAEEIREYIEKLPERIESIYSEIAAVEQKIEELNKKLEEAAQKDRLSVLVVDITVPEAGTYPFELRYFENRASWRPVYELYSDAKEPIDIQMRAAISQSTVEDWKDIEVSLFTGSPSSSGQLPELRPRFLSIRTQTAAPRTFARNQMMGAMAKAAGKSMYDEDVEVLEDAAEAPMMMASVRMETEQAAVNTDETVTEYALPGKRSILKGSEEAMADLTKYTVPAVYKIVAAAGADPHVYLVANVKTQDLPDIGGFNAGVYLKNRYAGEVNISSERTKESLDITLGEEERVHVMRKEVTRKQGSTLLKGQKTLDIAFETKVTNLSGAAADIELRDQIPVSRDKDITVETKDISGAKLEEETGMLTKELSVQPDATETFTVSYRISWPKDKAYTESVGSGFCPVCGYKTTLRFCPECGSKIY